MMPTAHNRKHATASMQLFRTACLGLIVFMIISPLVGAVEDYLLGGGDTVTITVYQQPDLTTTARISQDDGTITFPLIGEVTISGLTPEAAALKIARLLKGGGFIKRPEVALTVNEFQSQKIPIMGQVNKPGEYALKGESRVIDLIAQAGGLKEDAADVIVVVKESAGETIKHEVDLLKFHTGDMEQNIKVTQGDFILVPKMDAFYIHGEVKRPGRYRLERDMTVMQALSVGGGISDRGSLKGMKVTRRLSDGATEKVKVELTDKLQPEDVLYVKERLF
jgi:polysaccharide export outer membrane protein